MKSVLNVIRNQTLSLQISLIYINFKFNLKHFNCNGSFRLTILQNLASSKCKVEYVHLIPYVVPLMLCNFLPVHLIKEILPMIYCLLFLAMDFSLTLEISFQQTDLYIFTGKYAIMNNASVVLCLLPH